MVCLQVITIIKTIFKDMSSDQTKKWLYNFRQSSIDFTHTSADLKNIILNKVKIQYFDKKKIILDLNTDSSEDFSDLKIELLKNRDAFQRNGIIAINTLSTKIDQFLYVILPYYNFAKTKRRTQLFLEFLDRYKRLSSIRIVIAEATVNEFILPKKISKDVFMHLRYKYESPFWCKENLINVAIKKLSSSDLSSNWQYVAWIDPDITFLNKNWTQDTIHQLKSYDFVHMFETMILLGPNKEKLDKKNSFGFNHQNFNDNINQVYDSHTGFAIACTRWAYEKTRGIFDLGIVGGGDSFTMHSLHFKIEFFLSQFEEYSIASSFYDAIMEKQRLYKKYKITLSYTQGTTLHHWHGSFKDRQYWDRYKILRGYDPDIDIIRNSDGLINLSKEGQRMKNEIENFFIKRNDDNMKF